jgi:hypothetical protein
MTLSNERQLNEKQLDALRAFLALVHEAERDLNESFETGMMSDSKSSVFAVSRASEKLELPADMLAEIQQMALEARYGATGDGDVYRRAGCAIAAIGRIERYVEPLLAGE